MPIATPEALEGLGVPAQLAALIGGIVNTQAGAANNTQTGATILKSKSSELTATGTLNSFIVNPEININEPIFVFNSSANAAFVFPPVGGTMNGTLNGAINGGTGILQNKGAWFWQYKKGFWASVLTA